MSSGSLYWFDVAIIMPLQSPSRAPLRDNEHHLLSEPTGPDHEPIASFSGTGEAQAMS